VRNQTGVRRGSDARRAGKLVALTLAAAAGYRHVQISRLSPFPMFDCRAVKAPVAANAKTRQAPLAEESVDGGRMYAQVVGQFLNGEDIVP